MTKFADHCCKTWQFVVGDQVRLHTMQLKFRNVIRNFMQRYIDPFKVVEHVGKPVYHLDLPQQYSQLHPVLHGSLLAPWRTSQFWLVEEQEDLHVNEVNWGSKDAGKWEDPVLEVENLLGWEWTQRTNRRRKEYLVLWANYGIDEATWEPAPIFLTLKDCVVS